MESDTSQRSSIRVKVSFPFSLKKIDKEKYDEIKDTYTEHRTSDREKTFSAELNKLSIDLKETQFDKVDPAILHLFDVVMQKQDIIISLIGAKKKPLDDYQTAICKDISSGGLLIHSKDKMEDDDIYKLRIEFPTYPPVLVAAIAKVCGVKEINDQYETSLKFVVINGEDREELIGYVFRRQRELLRRRA